MLLLEIEHLMGVAFAALGQDSEAPEWPPQPDRVFSALVAAWGARGERAEERRALEWLEAQPAPEVAASGFEPRPAPIAYVPPNDQQSGKIGDKRVLPLLRSRYPRRFPAALPHDPTARLAWVEAEPDGATFEALAALARDVAYVGHSASLTRCYFRRDEGGGAALKPARRTVYPGRLDELEAAHRFHVATGRRMGSSAPSPGIGVDARRDGAPPAQAPFDPNWLVFAIDEEEAPVEAGEPAEAAQPQTDDQGQATTERRLKALDLRAAPLACKALIRAVMSGYEGAPVPREVSGHEDDGTPTTVPHLAAVPLAFLGWPHADGTLKGLALVPPRGSELFKDPGFDDAIRRSARLIAGRRRLALEFHGTGATGRPEKLKLVLTLVEDAGQASLDPRRYAQKARTWATATPIMLGRHLTRLRRGEDGHVLAGGNEARQDELIKLVREACAHAGLPEPAKVVPGKHAAVEGAPSAWASGKAPAWTRWRVPATLRQRPLTHAVIQFEKPVQGPLILGAGRFSGLGLCLPLDPERDR